VTITQAVPNVRLHADDAAGHTGDGNNFAVLAANDLALAASASNALVPLGANLVYTLNILNAGPTAATGVVVSNTLPANAAFVSFNAGQGSYSTSGQMLVWNAGTDRKSVV